MIPLHNVVPVTIIKFTPCRRHVNNVTPFTPRRLLFYILIIYYYGIHIFVILSDTSPNIGANTNQTY